VVPREIFRRKDFLQLAGGHGPAGYDAAGRAYLERLAARTRDRDLPVSPRSAEAQLHAIREWGAVPPIDRYATLQKIGRPTLVVNTHADWDHTWGNAAFPDTPIIAHRLCRAAMLTEGQRRLVEKQAEEPERYRDVTIVPPTITFAEFMEIDLGGLTLSIHHLPGHTDDLLVAYVPERLLLFATDAAEDPIPLISSGPVAPWARALWEWAGREVQTVVPSHGTQSGPHLLTANAIYLESLLQNPDCPDSKPDDPRVFYQEAHAANVDFIKRRRSISE